MTVERADDSAKRMTDGPSAALRPASQLMSPTWAGAAYPNALSFARIFVRRMQRERWRIELARLELDAEGRGEALYRVHAPGQCFHFFVISNVFPPDQKVDRSFGINWDVSAAICQGEWTPERESILREEIPKQYDGRYDNDVLCFCRGNRSERIFDHVVDSLAEGRQPDASLLTSVGYVLRSTAFAGNGLFGMTPFTALDEAHPLAQPYHAQMLSAYLMREFVFELIECIAAARNPDAAKLDRRLKRYLGLGNSAGLGLVPFIANHPQVIHRWRLTHEQAVAAAMSRTAAPKSEAAKRLMTLLDKAICYFGQEPRDGNGIFLSYERLGQELTAMRAHVHDRLGCAAASVHWGEIGNWAERHLHPEVVEIFNGLLLELYPDIVAATEERFTASERIDLDPAMTIAELKGILRKSYAWVQTNDGTSGSAFDCFWYYPVEAPYEPRRGVRGRAPSFELETPMDLPMRLAELQKTLAAEPDANLVATLVIRHPHLRAVIARVQSLAGLEYAEYRENVLAPDFKPFAACRFLLAFYGMEKYDPRPPRSTKGAFLQGAPLADEIPSGIEGDWPFPLAPLNDSVSTAAPPPPLRVLESPEVSVRIIQSLAQQRPAAVNPDHIVLFSQELRRLLLKALMSSGYPLGCSDVIEQMVEHWEAVAPGTLARFLDEIERDDSRSPVQLAAPWLLDGRGRPAFAAAAAALDLASAGAVRSQSGAGGAIVRGVTGSVILPAVVRLAAERGFTAALADLARQVITVAAPTGRGVGMIQIEEFVPSWALSDELVERSNDTPSAEASQPGVLPFLNHVGNPTEWLLRQASHPLQSRDRFALICLRPEIFGAKLQSYELLLSTAPKTTLAWRPEDIARTEARLNKSGFQISAAVFSRLSTLAKRALVPDTVEPAIIPGS